MHLYSLCMVVLSAAVLIVYGGVECSCTHCMIYLLTAIGLSPGGSTHLHTNNTQNNTNNNLTTQIQTNVEECGPCPVFASFTLALALQLRKKHGKTKARKNLSQVKKNLTVQYTYYQKLPHVTKPSQTHSVKVWICRAVSDRLSMWICRAVSDRQVVGL